MARAALAEEPGTYLLTDFLARTFEHTVVRELGLDRHPELRDAYFGHYTRVLWLAQRPTPATRAAAERAAGASGCRSRCAKWATTGSSASSRRCWPPRSGRRRPVPRGGAVPGQRRGAPCRHPGDGHVTRS